MLGGRLFVRCSPNLPAICNRTSYNANGGTRETNTGDSRMGQLSNGIEQPSAVHRGPLKGVDMAKDDKTTTVKGIVAR